MQAEMGGERHSLDVSLVPLVDVDGQVEMKSLVLFFMGNEKSLRGQQLTSMVDERRKTTNCRYRRCVCAVKND